MAHVFISYAHKDGIYARKLADYLLANGFDVWIDDRINFGSRWMREIFKAIDDCDAFIVIMTPRAYESEWVENERLYAKKRNKMVFPLLQEGEAFPDLGGIQYYDVSSEKLPGKDFLDRLSEFASRSEMTGLDVASVPQQQAKSRSQSPRRLLLLATAIIILAPIIALAINSALSGTTTPTPTEIAQILPTTSSPLILTDTPKLTTTIELTFTRTHTPIPPSATWTFTLIPSTITFTPTSTLPIRGSVNSLISITLRSRPGVNFSTIGALEPGSIIEILGRNNDGHWLNVRSGDGSEGWVGTVSIRIIQPAIDISLLPNLEAISLTATALFSGKQMTPNTAPTATSDVRSQFGLSVNQQAEVIASSGINLRSNPSTSAPELGLLNTFDYVLIVGGPVEAEGVLWWQVKAASGQIGWTVGSVGGVQLLSNKPQ